MNSIIGQNKILNLINSFTIDTFPRSLMIVGGKGSGKHLMLNEISKSLGIDSVNLESKIDRELSDEIILSPTPCIYYVCGNDLSDKLSNSILKILEEPLLNTFVILLCESENQVLDTIKNRCIIWNMEPYDKNELTNYFNCGKITVDVFDTPGLIMEYQNSCKKSLEDAINEFSTLLNVRIKKEYTNIFNISNRIKFRDEEEYDYTFDTVVCIIKYVMIKLCLDKSLSMDDRINYSRMYDLFNDFINTSLIPQSSKKIAFENFMLKLIQL